MNDSCLSRTVACLAAFLLLLTSGCAKSQASTERDDDSGASSAELRPFAGQRIELFIGSASKPPTEAAAAAFEKKSGATLELHFGGSGKMLSEMKLSERGDIYFPGSSDYMEIAKREGLVDPASEQRVVYLLPAINVVRGNPKAIKSVADLAKPGMRVGIARPDTVCVGLYAVELLESLGLAAAVKPNIVTHAESCEKTAQLVSLRTVDAVLGWEVFEHWDPKNIETIYLPPEQVTRIGYIPAAVGKNARLPALARAFIAFLIDEEGRAIYRRWHYATSVEEARERAMPSTPVGGEWQLPPAWQ
ncbi:MAG: molybdate ABC transporter substrate-binding protein [Polyangiaceae bacterium]|nr:molybdate ABC transporter substrate-binding protein [Polyangiaceae bacterium]